MTAVRKLFRCAIYTRKSTERNLDLEFNSLDAQREACEAYITSQAHEGWRLIPDPYDDGGLSGASLERPALQTLLFEINAGKIDTVVVYKVDRLTRSLTDFAKLVELFDKHDVSFVSITQSFNTTSSMGRLTLNVLLSFAQFEREVIGERVRDKIAASKRKGLWTGGPTSLGYANIGKKLVVVPKEAETVRTIYRRYLELGSISLLAKDLDRKGIRSKSRPLAKGTLKGGCRIGAGALGYLLRNRLYVGEIMYQGQIHPGEHEPILDRALFDEVQARLSANRVKRRARIRGSSAILTGYIHDAAGNRMSPSHTSKRGRRHRYYVSRAVLQRRHELAGPVTRVPAPQIEAVVMQGLRSYLDAAQIKYDDCREDRILIEEYIGRIVVHVDAIEIVLKARSDTQNGLYIHNGGSLEPEAPEVHSIKLPWTKKCAVAKKGISHQPSRPASLRPDTQEAILNAIAKARKWLDDLVTGRFSSIEEIAGDEEITERYVRQLMSLAFASPEFVRTILRREGSESLTLTAIASSFPVSWPSQTRLLQTQR